MQTNTITARAIALIAGTALFGCAGSPFPTGPEALGPEGMEAAHAVQDALRDHGYEVTSECLVGAEQGIFYVDETEWGDWCAYDGEVLAETVYHSPYWGACDVENVWVLVGGEYRDHRWDRALIHMRAALRHIVDCEGLEGADLFYTGTSAAFRSDETVEADALRNLTRCESLWCL